MTTTDASDNRPPAEINVEDFSSLVGKMSRFLSGLGRLQPFGDADLGVGEWVALTTLTQKDEVNNSTLARNLGVTRQRASQICTSLSRNGLVTVSQVAGDNRANDIKITEAGKTKVSAINAQLKPLLSNALQGKERSVASASRQINRVMAVVRAGRSDDKPGQEDRKAKRAAKAAERKAKRAASAAKGTEGAE